MALKAIKCMNGDVLTISMPLEFPKQVYDETSWLDQIDEEIMNEKSRKQPRTKNKKANRLIVTKEFLDSRVSAQYGKQAWIRFCERMMSEGFVCELYEARQTVSKYVTVIDCERKFKVRFSNHKPIHAREVRGDCNFFVGITNLGTTNTSQAIAEALYFFNAKPRTKIPKTPEFARYYGGV